MKLCSIGAGALLGSWLRWGLALMLTPIFPTIPLGTLVANLLGGYLVGISISLVTHHAFFSEEMTLFVITGFLGSLTTFSTFSAETVTLFARQEFQWAILAIGAHMIGSFIMTVLGLLTARMIWG
jgi:CrcB protein